MALFGKKQSIGKGVVPSTTASTASNSGSNVDSAPVGSAGATQTPQKPQSTSTSNAQPKLSDIPDVQDIVQHKETNPVAEAPSNSAHTSKADTFCASRVPSTVSPDNISTSALASKPTVRRNQTVHLQMSSQNSLRQRRQPARTVVRKAKCDEMSLSSNRSSFSVLSSMKSAVTSSKKNTRCKSRDMTNMEVSLSPINESSARRSKVPDKKRNSGISLLVSSKAKNRSDDSTTSCSSSEGGWINHSECGFNDAIHNTLMNVGEAMYFYFGPPDSKGKQVVREVSDYCADVADGVRGMHRELSKRKDFKKADDTDKAFMVLQEMANEMYNVQQVLAEEAEKGKVEKVLNDWRDAVEVEKVLNDWRDVVEEVPIALQEIIEESIPTLAVEVADTGTYDGTVQEILVA